MLWSHDQLMGTLGKQYPDAAWYYREPMSEAKNIKDYIAFSESCQVIYTVHNGMLNGPRQKRSEGLSHLGSTVNDKG